LHIIISGNPVDGFFYYGPFEDAEQALEYADAEYSIRNSEYWVTELTPPEEQ